MAGPGLNHNVKACLLLCVLSGIADSTWSGTVIAAFILIASKKNTTVGLVEAGQGLATLLFALPIGYLADKHGRSGVIKMGGVLCLCAAAATTWVILGVEREVEMSGHAMGILFAVMCLWGVVGGVQSGPAQALYADSIPTGERSKWYVYLFAAYIISSAVGPLVSIVVFASTKDEWTLAELRLVIVCGMVAEVGCAAVMFTFKDTAALGAASEAVRATGGRGAAGRARVAVAGAEGAGAGAYEPPTMDAPAAHTGDVDTAAEAGGEEREEGEAAGEAGEGREETGGAGSEAHVAEVAAPAAAPALPAPAPPALAPAAPPAVSPSVGLRRSTLQGAAAAGGSGCLPVDGSGRIPYVLFASSLFTALGSGMTVKFFPLYFRSDCNLSPEHVQLIYVAVPFAMVACSALVQRASITLGRVQMIVLCRALGVSLLLLMAILQLHSQYKGTPSIMVPIYIARTALMNSGYPLEESILMDYVPKSSRARWKSLESVSQFGWCGSAAIGGWLGDRYGYSYTFLLTAAIQGSATLLVATLLPLVPRREADGAAQLRAEQGEATAVCEEGGLAAEPAAAEANDGTEAQPAAARRTKPTRRNLSAALQQPLLAPTADRCAGAE
ncbi:major facilitator superfamily domain-containing protein [Pavlovales sp. CCMP2436]|nr:major facilitator superfamily domain-containing protein [Pavlovales sp. CCMP2436]